MKIVYTQSGGRYLLDDGNTKFRSLKDDAWVDLVEPARPKIGERMEVKYRKGDKPKHVKTSDVIGVVET